MATILITGLSGVGKSSVLAGLRAQGYNTVDTDYGYTIKVTEDGEDEVVWDRTKISVLLHKHQHSHLFISGCYANQGEFYHCFDQVVLLTAELEVMLERIERRTSHDYGKSPREREEIIGSYKNILPLLKKGATVTIDTTEARVSEVCERLKVLVENC